MPRSLESLVLSLAPAAPTDTCATVYDQFTANEDLITIPVVDGDHPLSLINRHEFVHALAQQYGRALYDRQPISTLMDAQPLVVDINTSLETLNRLIVDDNPNALLQGFFITHEERYIGIGTALSLLQHTNQHMHARARELDEARRSAEQASISKSRFLATMSHELRTPLNAVMGFSELIEQEAYGPAGDPHYVEYAGLIRNSGEHLLTIIDDVLDMSRIEAGKLELAEETFEPVDLVMRCVSILKTQAEEKGVALSIDHPSSLPELYADPGKMRQVVFNLVSNAVKFTPAGGSVEIRMRASDTEFILAVVDTGIGIDANDLSRVMEPFIQADNSLQRQYNGTGLGLPLTKSLIELHGGTLEIKSIKDVGTTVVARLPADRLVSGTYTMMQAG